MKIIIAGSRTLNPTVEEIDHYAQWHNINLHRAEIVSGTANGVDKAGEAYASWYRLKLHQFPADWEKFGKAAGPIRNRQMAEFADALLIIWTGESKGSKSMKTIMTNMGKPVYEVLLEKE